MIRFHKRAVIGITALGALGGVNASDANPIPSLSDNLRYAITPYLWAPGISGNIDYNNGQSAHTNISTDKVLKNLSIGAMGDAEVHYGRWGLLGNAIYAKLSNHGSKTSNLQEGIFATVDSTTDAWLGVYTVAGTYTAYVSQSLYVDTLVGARFLNFNSKIQLDASLSIPGYTADKTFYSSVRATDAIGGFKGRVRLGESSWFVPFYLDAGGGSSTAKFTSQQALGIGYAYKHIDLALYYNNLYYSLSNSKISSYINMTGPALAMTFKF